MHATLRKSADAKDLALVKLQRQIFDLPLYRQVFDGNHHFIRYLLAIIGTVIAVSDLAAYHQLLQSVRCCFCLCDRSDHDTITQNTDVI